MNIGACWRFATSLRAMDTWSTQDCWKSLAEWVYWPTLFKNSFNFASCAKIANWWV